MHKKRQIIISLDEYNTLSEMKKLVDDKKTFAFRELEYLGRNSEELIYTVSIYNENYIIKKLKSEIKDLIADKIEYDNLRVEIKQIKRMSVWQFLKFKKQ